MFNALFVIIGAALWATDTLFRHPLVQSFSPLVIVLVEHFIGTAFTLAWVLLFHRKKMWLGWKQTIGAILIGVFGSAIATFLFTLSFQYTNPSISILLQKVQPLIVILLSALFLGETFKKRFWIWSSIALISAFYISFPHGLSRSEIQNSMMSVTQLKGSFFALAAAGCWAFSTVCGKLVLKNTPSAVLTFWRFFFGLCTLMVMSSVYPLVKIELPFIYLDLSLLKSLFYMAIIPGFLGVTLYYRGLAKVSASASSILELSFPLCAMWINSRYLGMHLTSVQMTAALFLMLSMVMVGRRGN